MYIMGFLITIIQLNGMEWIAPSRKLQSSPSVAIGCFSNYFQARSKYKP